VRLSILPGEPFDQDYNWLRYFIPIIGNSLKTLAVIRRFFKILAVDNFLNFRSFEMVDLFSSWSYRKILSFVPYYTKHCGLRQQ
jgi:hypothetical protein